MTGMQPKTIKTIAALKELAAEGFSSKDAAAKLGLSVVRVSQLTAVAGIKLRHASTRLSDPRSPLMAAMYRDGYTQRQIGEQYGLSRERIRQILTKYHGIRRSDGGNHTKAVRGHAERLRKKDAVFLVRHGCTLEQWRELRDLGKTMLAAGKGRYQQPLYAYKTQKNLARWRGIGFDLSLWQWWTVWQQSGKWEQRGRGQGYVMCRFGDVGPYAIGNVFIDLARNNTSARKGKRSGLPIGVKITRKGTYAAKRSFNGKPHYLGSYPTPELAHAAYLAASA